MFGDVKQISDKVEILENKTEVMDRKLERKLGNLALLELRGKEFYLSFRAIPEDYTLGSIHKYRHF